MADPQGNLAQGSSAAGRGMVFHADSAGPAPEGARARIPVRRFGAAPDAFDEELSEPQPLESPSARTIAETGAGAVWLAALLAGCVAGYLLYVH